MKKNKRHLYKRLPKYALGTMKPIDLGYQPGRGIGSARFETEQNMSLEPETLAVRRSYIPNAIGKVTQYSPYVTEAIKDWTPATNTTTQQIGAVKPTGASRISPMSSQPAINTTSSVVPQMNIPGSTGNAVSSTAGSLTSRIANIASPYINASALSQIASNAGTAASSTASSLGGSLSNALQSTLTNGAKSASEALLASAPSAATLNSEVVAANLGEKALENASSSGASAGSGALGVAGKVAAGLGAAIGAYNMFNDITGFGDHRSASDMLANVGRSHVTTDYGNQYTTYNGVNAGQELAYEKANARSKQLGFGMNALGTGASIGSFFGPIGTAIGAVGGLLLGGLGSLFGWGDNSEEIERLTRLTNDNIANYNRQGEAVARSKDVAAEFNDRLGVAAAATGKGAYLPMDKFLPMFKNKTHGKDVEVLQGSDGPKIGIATSMGEKGEGAYNFETRQGSIIEGFEKGKGDAQPLYHTDGDSTVIFSKKLGFADIANPYILDTLRNWNIINNMKGDAQTLQVLKAVATAKIEKNDMKLREINNALSAFKQQMEMKKYKNGKLPGYWKGTDYLMSAIPHIAALGSSWNQYNRAKHADTHAPSTYVNNAAGAQALNELAQLRFDPTQYLTDAMRAYNQANFQANRMAGLGAGGQAILRNANYLNYLDSLGKIRIAQQDSDNKYRAAHANALAEYGAREQEALINDNIRRFQWQQQQNAAKEGWMAQYQKNGLTALADLASDVMGVRQFNRSEDYQDKMLKLYGLLVDNDADNAKAQLELAEQARLDREAAYREALKLAAEKTHPMFANYGSFRPDGIWNAFGDPIFNYKLNHPLIDQKYAKYFKPVGFKDGKGGFVSRGNNLGSYVEEIQPGNILGIGDSDGYSIKMITADGDTIYQKPGVFSKDVVRKKGGPASKEYIKAKQKHERLLKNATPSNNIGVDQLLRMFGF